MFNIYSIKEQLINDTASLFDQYRIFYKMESDLISSQVFISERFEKQDSFIFIAYKNNKPAGFTQIYPSFSSVAMKKVWILNDLFVSKPFRKSGCAISLLKHVEQQAKKRSIFSIKLATANSNKEAKNLYHKLGYQLTNEFEHFSKIVAE